MKKTMIATTTLIAITMITASAFAWGPGRGMSGACRGFGDGTGNNPDCPRYGNAGPSEALNLTQEQKSALAKLRQQLIDDTYELRTLKMQKKGELRLLVRTSNPDEDKIETLAEEISDLQRQLMIRNIQFNLAAKKIAPELEFGMGGGPGQNRGKKGAGRGWNTPMEN